MQENTNTNCKKIYDLSKNITNLDLDIIERENNLALIIELLYDNLKKIGKTREYEFRKITLIFLQALDYENIENIDHKKSIAIQHALNIYRNPKITELDIKDVRKILRYANIDILRPFISF